MELSENFQELKQQFAAIGYNSPDIDNKLRQNLAAGLSDFTIYHQEDFKRLTLNCYFNLRREQPGEPVKLDYYESLMQERESLTISTRSFDPEVNKEEACQTLAKGIKFPSAEDNASPWILQKEAVRQYLAEDNPGQVNYFDYLNKHTMNEQNLEYLKNGLTNLGYGDSLHKDLEQAIERKQTDIQLHHSNEYNGDKMEYTLHLKRSDKSDMYFLNATEAVLKKEGQEQEIKQSFGIKKNHGITAKEAYNLMDGRSIEKKLYNDDGTVQSRWLKLDFTEKNQYGNYKMYRMYPYNLERELQKYPIAELSQDYSKNELIRSLKKGNAQQATIEQDGQQVKYYLSANPAERTLDIHDANKQVVKRELLQKQGQKNEQKQDQKNDQKQTQKNTQQQKQSRGRKTTAH